MITPPLFYRNIAPLNRKRHQNLFMEPITSHDFARGINSVVLLAAEFPAACKEYPIVFVEDAGKYFSAAIVGLADAENLFLTRNGSEIRWQARYIPAYVRRYPFIPATGQEGSELTVCIDEGYAGFNRDGRGEALFRDDGSLGPLLERAVGFMQNFQAQHQSTVDFCAKLNGLGLLEPMRADGEFKSGERFSLGGFFVINRPRFAALDSEKIIDLFKQNELELVYAHLFSLSNFERLLELKKQATDLLGVTS